MSNQTVNPSSIRPMHRVFGGACLFYAQHLKGLICVLVHENRRIQEVLKGILLSVTTATNFLESRQKGLLKIFF